MNEMYIIICILPCLLVIIYIFFTTRHKKKQEPEIDEAVLETKIAEFNPEPLIDTSTTGDYLELYQINCDDGKSIDFTKTNYLNLLNHHTIKKAAEECIRKYGVGTCGPRGFYGTTDIHLQLEQQLAKYLQVEETIIYAYGFTTISSSIAAYCKAGDLIFCDENINFAIQQGIKASRSKALYFPHNDYNTLKEIAETMETVTEQRKFLILEDIYFNTGKLCPLPKFLQVAKQFKLRVFLEENISLGTLGKTGHGILEHFNINPEEIDMIIGTLEGAFGSIGGFCAGSSHIIEHQRLKSAGYIFSASLPTYICQAALNALPLLESKSEQVQKLSKRVHNALKKIRNFHIISDAISPLKIFTTGSKEGDKKVHKYCRNNQVHIINRGDCLALNLNVELFVNKPKLTKALEVLKNASLSV